MPLLAGGRIVGRVDPKREGRRCTPSRSRSSRSAIARMADALREAAEWVGCDSVALGRVDPPAAAAPLRAALDG